VILDLKAGPQKDAGSCEQHVALFFDTPHTRHTTHAQVPAEYARTYTLHTLHTQHTMCTEATEMHNTHSADGAQTVYTYIHTYIHTHDFDGTVLRSPVAGQAMLGVVHLAKLDAHALATVHWLAGYRPGRQSALHCTLHLLPACAGQARNAAVYPVCVLCEALHDCATAPCYPCLPAQVG